LVSGFWHGANWTFIVWGALNALYFMPLLLLNKNRSNVDIVAHGKLFPSFKELVGMVTTFCLTMLAWIFFRSETVSEALEYIGKIFSASLFRPVNIFAFVSGSSQLAITFLLILFFLIVEWRGREQQYALARFGVNWYKPVRWTMYYFLITAIFLFTGKEHQFIYFQF
jgi:D-alanyl-lipoteichoic acid acyltransferase DltB (MBOAT superfamily)